MLAGLEHGDGSGRNLVGGILDFVPVKVREVVDALDDVSDVDRGRGRPSILDLEAQSANVVRLHFPREQAFQDAKARIHLVQTARWVGFSRAQMAVEELERRYQLSRDSSRSDGRSGWALERWIALLKALSLTPFQEQTRRNQRAGAAVLRNSLRRLALTTFRPNTANVHGEIIAGDAAR